MLCRCREGVGGYVVLRIASVEIRKPKPTCQRHPTMGVNKLNRKALSRRHITNYTQRARRCPLFSPTFRHNSLPLNHFHEPWVPACPKNAKVKHYFSLDNTCQLC